MKHNINKEMAKKSLVIRVRTNIERKHDGDK